MLVLALVWTGCSSARPGPHPVGLRTGEARVNYLSYLFDPAHWTGSHGIPVRLVEHLATPLSTLLIALVAVPVGAWIGHTGRGGFLVVGLANGLRALPTLGLLRAVLVVAVLGGGSVLCPIIALVILAVPPILAGTYAGVRIDPAASDAARGMGMRGREVLLGVELPNALPLIIGGVRSSRCR